MESVIPDGGVACSQLPPEIVEAEADQFKLSSSVSTEKVFAGGVGPPATA